MTADGMFDDRIGQILRIGLPLVSMHDSEFLKAINGWFLSDADRVTLDAICSRLFKSQDAVSCRRC